MSASLVGSEMCIRDSPSGARRKSRHRLGLASNRCEIVPETDQTSSEQVEQLLLVCPQALLGPAGY
eukprot:243136-Alexandrium_andersonii.AAC.1